MSWSIEIRPFDLFTHGAEFSLPRSRADRGAQAVVAGYTEVPLVLKEGDLSVPVIDTISILAKAAILETQGRKRRS